MKRPVIQERIRDQRRVIPFLLLFGAAALTALIMCLYSPLPVFALSSTQRLLSPSHMIFQNQSGPDPNQLLSEAQNDLGIANSIITFTGVFMSIVAIAIAVAGVFEIRGLHRLQTHIQQALLLEKQIKEQIALLTERSKQERSYQEEQLNGIAQLAEKERDLVKEQLQHLDEHVETERKAFKESLDSLIASYEQENQKFMEASYNFTQGKQAYLDGDDLHATEYFYKALQLQPNNVRIRERLGRTYSNRNDIRQAISYLEQALKLDPQNEPALRSIALCYRYTDPAKAISYLEKCLDVNANSYEALDFLGLIHRDQGRIDEAIRCHERARTINERPETDFYLSLLYASKGNKRAALLKAMLADENTEKPEHEQRMRPIWKNIVHAAIPILNGQKEEALFFIRNSQQYLVTHRIYDAFEGHLRFLLNATDHADWISEFMDLVTLVEPSST